MARDEEPALKVRSMERRRAACLEKIRMPAHAARKWRKKSDSQSGKELCTDLIAGQKNLSASAGMACAGGAGGIGRLAFPSC